MAVLAHAIEYLHPRPLATSVTYDEASALYQDSNFPRVPEKTLGLTLVAEHVLEHAIFIENLKEATINTLTRDQTLNGKKISVEHVMPRQLFVSYY